MRRAAFDVDGTLVDQVNRHGFTTPTAVLAGTLPNAAACARARRLEERGWRLEFVTGRGRHLHDATVLQLGEALQTTVRADQVHTQTRWNGYPTMIQYKAKILRELKPEWYCGDHGADREAAHLAEVPFVDAAAWRRGDPVEVL